MQNAVLVKMNGEPFVTLLIHEIEFKSLGQVLDEYAKWGGFKREHMTGCFIDCVDITCTRRGQARKPVAEGEWPGAGSRAVSP